MKKKIPQKRKSIAKVQKLVDKALRNTPKEIELANAVLIEALDSSRTLVNYSKLSPPNQRAAMELAMTLCELAGDFK
jgi:hypothetical protein